MIKKIIAHVFMIATLFGASSIFMVMAEGEVPIEIGVVKENGVRYVTSEEATSLIKQRPEMIVLDVRTAGEFRRGHIEGAINVGYFPFRFKKRIKDLDPDAAYLVYCKSGHRSNRSVSIMLSKDFKDITHMDGGFDAWKDSDLPFVSE